MIDKGHLSFRLPDDFVGDYEKREVDWGYMGENGVSLGEVAFLVNYSRQREDGTKERWHECLRRVVEGTFSIQKNYCRYYHLPWSERKAQRSAQEMYERMFTFKFLPPGRGLWMMGTEYIFKHGAAALNNCAFVSTEGMADDPVRPFTFLMDASMLGVGVGFDTKGAYDREVDMIVPKFSNVIHQPSSAVREVVITDSREGWVRSTALLLGSYLKAGRPRYDFKYHKIRQKGEPIRGFGGTSAGPDPLIKLHRLLRKRLEEEVGNFVTSRLITDIANLIGKCVVAGNVRRSAEIALGDPLDDEFASLKDWTDPKNKERLGEDGWGWMSNNTLTLTRYDEDEPGLYEEIAHRMADSGEPGILWLDRARRYGRITNGPDGKDMKAMGTNPCSEQTLESYELCCLVETFPSRHDTLNDYIRSLKFAYLYAKSVTLLRTHWPETNAIMKRNHRIGCSMSGLAQFVEEQGFFEMERWMDNGYAEVQRRDHQYSAWLGVRESIKTTSIKPSGTVSLLAGVTPGVHWPVRRTYIRRMRISKGNPIVGILREAGYVIEDAPEDREGTYAVEFPVKGPQIRTQFEVPLRDKFALAACAQRYWADNQVSATITFSPDEVDELAQQIEKNAPYLKSISALPTEDTRYERMPYEPIEEDVYEVLSGYVVEADLEALYEGRVGSMAAVGSKYCDGDSCEI